MRSNRSSAEPEKLVMNEAQATRRAEMLDGKSVAAAIKREVTRDVQQFRSEHGVQPGLAAVRVGDDAASAVYVRNKIKACEEVGIRS
jgi:methylenetetrahydrofolate dehydrogenase (NADP+) / methenyltetrahydrofolate cyclohydrolase